MLQPPIDGADPSTSAHHRSLNVDLEFKRVFHRAQNLLNLCPGTCRTSNPISPFLFSCKHKVATDSGTGLVVLQACRHSGSSGCCAGNGGDDGSGGGSGDGGGGDGGGGSGGDDDGGCDGDDDGGCDSDGDGGSGGGGGGSGGDDGGCGGNSSSYA